MAQNSSERRSLLEEARSSVHFPVPLDETGRLAAHNLYYGIGRLIYGVQEVGAKARISFKASLDFTITRSSSRWGSGFSYGGVLEIFSDDLPIVAPEVRPNTCGALVGLLHNEMSDTQIVSNILTLTSRITPGSWDYSRRNHFLNIYRSVNSGRQVFILHGCPESLRSDGSNGPGLYLEQSTYWREKFVQVETPLGSVRLIVGAAAIEYWENYARCERASKEHRVETAREIFDSFDIISNETHEGMINVHQYILGCHSPEDWEGTFPLMTSLGQPAYMISAKASSLVNSLKPKGRVAILPHGTGYSLPLPGTLERVECSNDGIILYYFRNKFGSLQVLRDFSNVPYDYRLADLARQWANEGHFLIQDTLLPEVFTKL